MTITLPVIIWFVSFLVSVHLFCIARTVQVFSRIIGHEVPHAAPIWTVPVYWINSIVKIVSLGFIAYDNLWLGIGLVVFGFLFTAIMPIPTYYRRMICSKLAFHEQLLLGIHENDDDFLHKL